MKSSSIGFQIPHFNLSLRNFHWMIFGVVSEQNIHNYLKILLKYSFLQLCIYAKLNFNFLYIFQLKEQQQMAEQNAEAHPKIQIYSLKPDVKRFVKMSLFSLNFFLYLPYSPNYETPFSSLQGSLFSLNDQHSCYVGNRVRVQRSDVWFIADGLEESGNHMLKRQAGVIMVLVPEVVCSGEVPEDVG